jgi:hypothetical protein
VRKPKWQKRHGQRGPADERTKDSRAQNTHICIQKRTHHAYHATLESGRIHCGEEVTELSTNKQHTLSMLSLSASHSFVVLQGRDRASECEHA